MEKTKHNKKRNTAFLYESLVRELTKSIINKDAQRKEKVLSILKEHFSKNSILGRELELYQTIQGTDGLPVRLAEKMLYKIKLAYDAFSKQDIFDEQSEVIKKINKDLSKSVYSTFVPNYKSLASISQLFNSKLSIKSNVILEENIITQMTRTEISKDELVPVDNLVFKSFSQRYNEQYAEVLSESQKTLLNKYILSFTDNGTELMVYLNEEIGRLKDAVSQSLTLDEIREDKDMIESTKKVIDRLDEFKERPIDKEMILDIFKVQNLVQEIQS